MRGARAAGALLRAGPSGLKLFKECSRKIPSDPKEYHRMRVEMVRSHVARGGNTFPHIYDNTIALSDFVNKYGPMLTENGKMLEEETVRVDGCIFFKREHGTKLIFYDLYGGFKKIQLLANAKFHKAGLDDFLQVHGWIMRGDLIGVEGHPYRSKRGELGIVPTDVQMIEPWMYLLPPRMTFMDFILTPEVHEKP